VSSERTTLYRDKQHAKLTGLCAGIADYTGVSVGWVRIGALLMIPLTGLWVIPAYFIASLFLPKKPPHLYVDAQEQKYWQRVRQSPQRTAREIRARFRDVDRRLADVENYYVSSNPRLSAEIERLR